MRRQRVSSARKMVSKALPVVDDAASEELARLKAMLEGLLSARAREHGTDPQPASLARRADIISAAIHVIARDGIRACTISALERATGFARGHFTYHFRSKEEIIGLAFAAVGLDWATAQGEGTVGATALDRLEQRVRNTVSWAQRRRAYFQCVMNFRVEMMRDPSAFPPAARVRAQIWEATAQMIRDGIAEGSFRPRADPLTEARIVYASVDGVIMHAALDASLAAPETLPDLAWALVADRLGVPPTLRAAGRD